VLVMARPVKLLLQQLACASNGETDCLAKLLLQLLACASDGEAGWLHECWQSWLSVLLLVCSLLWCCLDVGVAVTDGSALEVHIFILLSLGSGRTNGHCCHGER
jgi:hypothetical protein